MLSPELLRRNYREEGFVAFPRLFSEEEVGEMLTALEALIGSTEVLGPVHPENPRLDFDGTQLKMIEPVLDLSPVFASVAADRRVQEIFEAIFEDAGPAPTDADPAATGSKSQCSDQEAPLRLFEDKTHMKVPSSWCSREGGELHSSIEFGAFPWHQDAVFWSSYPSSLATLIIYLDEATQENGCLQVSKHPPAEGLLPHVPGANPGLFPLSIDGADRQRVEARSLATIGPAGSAVLFSCMTPHASLPNRSAGPRRSFFLSYNPAADGDWYNNVSAGKPLYDVGSHNRGVVPKHKIEAWRAWREAGSSTGPDGGGGHALIWGPTGSKV